MVATKDYSYDEVPYPKLPHKRTHPRNTETIAALFGMETPPITKCRVLELGCAAGDNLIPQSQDLPESQFVGVDLSAVQVEEGQRAVEALGLENIELRHASIMDIGPDWGEFDYIICHGVFSWVPKEVQDKIIEICKVNLSDNGAALVSYNTYPGWHFNGMIRDMMVYHVAQFADPKERIRQARGMLDFLVENSDEATAYGKMLKEKAAALRKSDDAYLYHDHLEENNHPLYFGQFVERAAQTGLQYLGDSEFATMLHTSLPTNARKTLEGTPIIRQEQYMDFVRNRAFRSTLLCHQGIELNRRVTSAVLPKLYMTTTTAPDVSHVDVNSVEKQDIPLGQGSIGVGLPLMKAAIVHLAQNWPDSFSLSELHAAALKKLSPENRSEDKQTQTNIETLATNIMILFTQNMLDLYVHPPRFATNVSSRPVASPLARLQAASGARVTNRRHESVSIDAVGRELLRQLDGKHEKDELEAAIQKAIESGALTVKRGDEQIDGLEPGVLSNLIGHTLSKFRETALLVA